MGFIKRVTGQQAAADANNRNAAATEAASRQSAQANQQQLQATAKAAADEQATLSARSKAEQDAADAASTPLQTADVQIDADNSSESAVDQRRTRRAAFGRNYNTGVSV